MASGLRVAVRGVAGSIGSKLVERLAASDGVDSVVAFDARPVVVDHSKGVSFQQDIRQPLAGILRRHGVDAFVHLAFLLRAGRNREAARRVNVGGTAEVVRGCRAAGVRRLLYLSSTTVYGARAGGDPQPYTEESPVRPGRGFQYAEDKAATESMLEAFAADNPDTCVTVLRGCLVVGPPVGELRYTGTPKAGAGTHSGRGPTGAVRPRERPAKRIGAVPVGAGSRRLQRDRRGHRRIQRSGTSDGRALRDAARAGARVPSRRRAGRCGCRATPRPLRWPWRDGRGWRAMRN